MKREYLVLVFMVLIALLMRRFFLWVKEGPVTPDPWAKEDDDAVKQTDAVPLCPRCLSPQEEDCRFCAACGSATGLYNNWSPYLYIFSMGEVLRLGTGGSIQTNLVTVLGYLLLSVAQYTVFAPVYWFLFFRNLGRIQREAMTSQAQQSVP
jgi:hypothetical protein